ncbi:MAG: hypothetical protein ACI81O_000532 [Cyclobacteriaceae bacterium]|jgi:hypothetical protein
MIFLPMTDTTASEANAPLTGSMYLYTQPELLNSEAHADLGLVQPTQPFAFAAKVRAIPIIANEFSSVQKSYPIVFNSLDNPMPVAVVGLLEDKNLFVDEHGEWSPYRYVPAYLRRYPFALAGSPGQQAAVVVDVASSRVSKNPEHAFFKDGQVTAQTQTMIDFCQRYDTELQQTAAFGQRLKALDLLVQQTATRNQPDGAEPEVVAQFITIDLARVTKLSPALQSELFLNGYLSTIFAQGFSMENWNTLIALRAKQKP